jgi:hypothetical protein
VFIPAVFATAKRWKSQCPSAEEWANKANDGGLSSLTRSRSSDTYHHWMNLEIMFCLSVHKQINTIWFHLQEAPRLLKPIQPGRRMAVALAGEREVFNEHGASVLQDEKVVLAVQQKECTSCP